MTEKRYFSIDYDEEYYIFDSNKISEEEVLEKAEYSYDIFGESLMEDDIVNLLNENEQLKASNVEMEDYLGRLEERIQELETFIKKIADNNGNIVLINGYEYNIKKVILNE